MHLNTSQSEPPRCASNQAGSPAPMRVLHDRALGQSARGLCRSRPRGRPRTCPAPFPPANAAAHGGPRCRSSTSRRAEIAGLFASRPSSDAHPSHPSATNLDGAPRSGRGGRRERLGYLWATGGAASCCHECRARVLHPPQQVPPIAEWISEDRDGTIYLMARLLLEMHTCCDERGVIAGEICAL